MKKILLLVSAFTVAMTLSAGAQNALSDKLAYDVKREGFSNNSQVVFLSQFMTDKMGPRLAASQMKLRAE